MAQHFGYLLCTSSWTEPAIEQDRRCFLRGPGVPRLQGSWWVLRCGSSHCSRLLHPQLGTPPVAFTGLTSRPLLPNFVTPALTDGLTMARRISGGGEALQSPGQYRTPAVLTLQPGTPSYHEEKDLPAPPEVLLRGTGCPSSLLSAGDPTPRRGKDTQDVLCCHFRRC